MRRNVSDVNQRATAVGAAGGLTRRQRAHACVAQGAATGGWSLTTSMSSGHGGEMAAYGGGFDGEEGGTGRVALPEEAVDELGEAGRRQRWRSTEMTAAAV